MHDYDDILCPYHFVPTSATVWSIRENVSTNSSADLSFPAYNLYRRMHFFNSSFSASYIMMTFQHFTSVLRPQLI